jgi:hypothetical protein
MQNLLEDDNDIRELRRIYEQDLNAKALCDYLADRGKALSRSPVDGLLSRLGRHGTKMRRPDLIKLLKDFERLQLGEFLAGRRGKPSRFKWKADSISVGKVASGAAEEFAWLSSGSAESETEAELEMLTHLYRLRMDLTVTLVLPANLTKEEAERLSLLIKSLPF